MKNPWTIDGEVLADWLNTQFSNTPYGAVSAKIKEIYNEVQSGRLNVKEEPNPNFERGDRVRHKSDDTLYLGEVIDISKTGKTARVKWLDYNKRIYIFGPPHNANYRLEKLENVSPQAIGMNESTQAKPEVDK